MTAVSAGEHSLCLAVLCVPSQLLHALPQATVSSSETPSRDLSLQITSYLTEKMEVSVHVRSFLPVPFSKASELTDILLLVLFIVRSL